MDNLRWEANRLRTFQLDPPWPHQSIDPKELARAGYFYYFIDDRVQCAFCRGINGGWQSNDDPLAEHARSFPRCPFIMGADVGNIPIGEDPIPGPKRARPYDVCGTYSSLPTPASQQQAAHSITSPPTDMFHTQSNLNISSYRPSPQPPLVHRSMPRLNSETFNTFNHLHRQTQHQHTAMATSYTVPSLTQPSNQRRNSNNPQLGICKICYLNEVGLTFLPCGHGVACLSCAQFLRDCPMCRGPIHQRIRLFLA